MTENITIVQYANNINVVNQDNVVTVDTQGVQGPQGISGIISVLDPIINNGTSNSASLSFSSSPTFSGKVTASAFQGNGSLLTYLTGSAVNGYVNNSFYSSSVINGVISNSFINLSTTKPVSEGSIFYDLSEHHALNIVTDTPTPQELGQQVLARVVNGTSDNTTLTKGTLVYLSGATGNRVRVDRAIANDINKHDVLGIVYDNIANNAEGFVLTFGVIDNVNTNNGTYTAGDTLYLSSTNAGQYTNIAPSYPSYKVEIGKVARANVANGRILFYINSSYAISSASGNLLVSDGYRAIGSSNATLDLLGNLNINKISTASPSGYVKTPTLQISNIASSDATNAIVIGPNRNIGLAASAGYYGNGSGVVYIANATTIPNSNATNGGILYASAGALYFRGGSGTITPIAPA